MSEELWEAVKLVAFKVFTRKYWAPPEERMSLAALACTQALESWEPARGDYAMTVYYYAIKQADEYRKNFSQCVRLPMNYSVDIHGEFDSIKPDGFRLPTGEDSGVDYWDSLLKSNQEDESVSDELKAVLARMPEKFKEVYRMFYEYELRYVDISEMIGLSNTVINERLKAMRSWVKKELKKNELGRKLGTNGKKSDP